MFLFVVTFVALSSSVPCDIKNCESCSIQSSRLCINCHPGYTRNGVSCISQTEFLREPIENCLSYTDELACSSCKSGYFTLHGRCEPNCLSKCICGFPNTCLNNRNLDETNGSTESNNQEDNNEGNEESESGNESGNKNDRKNDNDDTESSKDGSDQNDNNNNNDDTESSNDSSNQSSDEEESNRNDHGDHDDQYDCHEGCNRCSNYYICEECEKNYNLTNGTCVTTLCHSKCETCSSGICSECSENFYLQENTCKSCPKDCKKCSNDTYCEECENGNATETGMCLSNTNKDRVKTSKSIIVPIVSSFGGIIVISGIVFCVINKRKKDKAKKNRKTIDLNDESTPGFLPINEANKKEDDYEGPSGIMSNHEVNGDDHSNNPPVNSNNIGPGINEQNFKVIVQKVSLDSENKYYNQEVCVICIQKFELNAEIRALPCNHAFHEACIFKAVATGTEKTCPICRRQYN